MGKSTTQFWQRLGRVCIALISLLAPMAPSPSSAAGGDRSLYLYYTHTKETARITFRRGGRYDSKGLAELNHFLRDWRRNESTKMDPALFDLLWEVYRESKASGPIHVVSAYRAPATNDMLRSRSRGVAKNSRHTMGMALDFFIPSVKVSNLRQVAMRKQVGGVGYYPTSGNPFVHLDTGNVRAWPRMTRAQLKKLFPDGRTLHIPNDGNPISKEGYAFAKAQWTRCKTVPCSGRSTTTIRVANNENADPSPSGGNGGTLLDWLLGNNRDEAEDRGGAKTQISASVQTAAITQPPVPFAHPKSLRPDIETNNLPDATDTVRLAALGNAPLPLTRPSWLNDRTGEARQSAPSGAERETLAVASVESNTIATPRQLLSQPQRASQELLTAYAPTIAPEPDAQRAVQMLIERRNKQPGKPVPNLNTQGLRLTTATLGDDEVGSFAALFDKARDAITTGGLSLSKQRAKSPNTAALVQISPPHPQIQAREARFFAPDLEHVIDIFMDPSLVSSSRYAVLFDRDETDFSPATELGGLVTEMTFTRVPRTQLEADRFQTGKTLLVASRALK